MNTPLPSNSHYSLHNVDNYKNILSYSTNDILNKYNLLVLEYLNFMIESVNIKNNNYIKFIILRGLKTITHVFNFILYYSKNLDMAFYHGQKSFYFYIEFIGQISEEQHTFLQLSSRDALMFVYKKTICEINNEYKKNMAPPTKDITDKLDILNINISILKTIISYMINNFDFLHENKKELLKKQNKMVEQICENLNNYKLTNDAYNTIQLFVDTISNNINITSDNYFDIIILFIKKYVKSKMSNAIDTKIHINLTNLNYEINVEEDAEKFVTCIFA